MNTNWSYPTSIRFGTGRIKELGAACIEAGVNKPLLVTDPGLAELPITRQAISSVETAGLSCSVFSNIKPNPTGANIEAGLQVMRVGNHDGVIAFGGGSGLDAGKVIAFMHGQTRPIWDFEDIDDWWKRADPAGIAPIIAVPTTAGTGSEVGRAGVITNEQTRTKKIIFHPRMLPHTVICDAELTRDLPPALTAGTGIDAFVHCLEAYCAPTYHPMSEGIAVEGMRLIKEYLPIAYNDGTNIEARGHLLSAAAMGATAFQKGLGAIHALSHPVGAIYDTHHGLTNAVFMPYLVQRHKPVIEEKLQRLTRWLDIEGGFDGFVQYLLDMRKSMGICHTIKELGVSPDDFETLAEMAVQDPSMSTNPVPLTRSECVEVLENAYSGQLTG
jgi:alcohol dehydrogenase